MTTVTFRTSRTMDQDWTTVTLRRRLSTKEAQSKGHAVTQYRDPEQQERVRLAKLENTDEISPPKKRPDSKAHGTWTYPGKSRSQMLLF